MEDSKGKYENKDVTPEQVLESTNEDGREIPDKQLEGIAGGGIPTGPIHNPFA